MKNLFIMGTVGSGKTAVALGLALKLIKEGYKVTYFKPVGRTPRVPGQYDVDGILMKEVLGIKAPVDLIVPHRAGANYLSSFDSHCGRPDHIRKIMDAYHTVTQGYDITLIDGTVFPYAFSACGLDSLSLAKDLSAAILLVLKIKNDFSFDAACFFQEHLKITELNCIGSIFNNVPRPVLAKCEGIYKPILDNKGCKTLGIIPRRPEIAAPTVSEFYELLGGEILSGEDRMESPVEDVVVGAMTMESALTYLRRSANKAVILGGDRSDLALAALETHTSVLILTGGLYPDIKVIARAAEKGVPVILVYYDTYTTIEKLGKVTRSIRPGDKASIGIALENIEKYCDIPEMLNRINSI